MSARSVPVGRAGATSTALPDAAPEYLALASLFVEHGAPRAFGHDWPLARLGDTSAPAYFVRAGQAKITAPTDRGVAIVGFRRAGQFVGIGAAIDGEPRISAATAWGDRLTAYALPAERLMYHLGRSREASFEVSRLLAAQLRDETLRLLENQGSVVNRMARCLLRLASPDGKVELTQAELAATIGASQVSVENGLRAFRANKIITTSYGLIVIDNRRRLQKVSGQPANPAATDASATGSEQT